MITIQDIIDQFGAYYIAGSQNTNSLMIKIFQPSESDVLFDKIPTKDTVLRKGNVQIGGVLQAWQKQFTPYGDTTISGRQIDLYPLKIDLAEQPDILIRSWVGFLAGMEEVDRTKWPFIRWWLEQLVKPQADQDWELTGVYNGVLGTIVPGTPLPASQAVNGIKKLINNEIATGDCEPVMLGAVPTDPKEFVEYVEAFVRGGIPMLYRPYLQQVAFSNTLEERWKDGMLAKYDRFDGVGSDNIMKVVNTNVMVKGFASHEGSDKMWTTIKGNAVMGLRKPQNAQIFEIEKIDRMVKAYTDFDKGMGYWRPELIYTNDVELPA